ncbi:glycosyltransferase [Longilinea arvoryzae]|uniref:Glycosyltransferase n=1 Tax=Longilinea arvoryzae TaxID=360412 RepID=A0A0S7BAF0_9CHLR|nr:glycosyltransferase family 4 protein [Longilinea arvoryzae]GAP14414.1 glycosyltransferase [Longilinea arvoryzae]
MKILVVLTYYRPHTSGLTIYAERLCKAWAERGHQVTVLTSQYDPSLPEDEIKDGVHIVRAPVLFRLSKGVIMPTFGRLATRLTREADVIQLHLPQFDAAGVALRGRILRKPTVITYHCDLLMPRGLVSWLANQAVRVMNNLAGIFTHRIVTYTRDYAENSDYLTRYLRKLQVIPPPVVLPTVSAEAVQSFAAENNPQHHKPVIGMAARFATEKGVEVLLDALPVILQHYPDAQVQFAGPYQNIIGEESYFARLSPTIEKYIASGNWRFVGSLSPEQMAAYYPNLNVLVLPSLNSTEAFGLVQIEAMLNGVPCVASNLPGVRQPVKIHAMGQIAPIGDVQGLAQAALEVLDHPEKYTGDPVEIVRRYEPATIAVEYEKLFAEMQHELLG